MSKEKNKHHNKTSYPNQKNNAKHPRVVMRKFLEMLNNTEEDENILCFQDACHSIKWRDSKINYWVSKHPRFADLKKDVQNIIIRRINRNALKKNYHPVASIWRMKQLGEKEKIEQNINIASLEGIDKISFID